MRLAIHSISWGEDVELNALLYDISKAGYSGVELFQHPETLGPPSWVCEAFQEHSLHLLGVSGGAFEERLAFVRQYADLIGSPYSHEDVPYIYLDERVNEAVLSAVNQGFRIALHPHMFRPVQTLGEAERVLNQHQQLRLIPDTAHLTIAGDDPAGAVEQFASRIDVVHMKDWQENVGRAYQFYARGFCELGAGDIDLERVLDVVIRRMSGVWLVVEQDWTLQPFESAKRSRKWLTSRLGRSIS